MSFIDTITNTTRKVSKIVKETYGPLAALDAIVENGIYQYPLDVGNTQRYPHTVEFQTWIPKQVPISEMGVVQDVQTKGTDAWNKKASDFINKQLGRAEDILGGRENLFGRTSKIKGYVDPYLKDMMQVDRNKKFNDRITDFMRRADRSDMITMYMPQGSWADRINNAYNQQSMTAALGKAGMIIDVAGAISKEDVSTWDMINGPAGIEALSKAALPDMDGGVLRDAGLNAIGYALNPQFEMLYNGTDLREFQFDFNMTPRSQDEALMIRNIIKKFKYHASPAFVSGQGRYIVPPSYFDISFKFNGSDSEWLPQISTCVLKSFDIDYTGGLEQWATHADGSPIQIKMVLVFAELEMMHKSLRKEGY
jgi:Tail-tube assembly protein